MLRFEEAQQIINHELEKYAIDRFPERTCMIRSGISLSLGGKRLRPALTLMTCSIFSDAVHMPHETCPGLLNFSIISPCCMMI